MNTMYTVNQPINFMDFRLSKHMSRERVERYMEIQMEIGFGDRFVAIVEMENKYECLTNTGVVMVISKDTYNGKWLVITTYVGTIDKASAMFKSTGSTRLPSFISTAIIKANKKKNEKVKIGG